MSAQEVSTVQPPSTAEVQRLLEPGSMGVKVRGQITGVSVRVP